MTSMRTAAAIITAALLALTLTGCVPRIIEANQPTLQLPTEMTGTGTFTVGEDIAPGTYKQTGDPTSTCKYGIQNEAGKTVALNNGDAILISHDGDQVRIEDCGTWTLQH